MCLVSEAGSWSFSVVFSSKHPQLPLCRSVLHVVQRQAVDRYMSSTNVLGWKSPCGRFNFDKKSEQNRPVSVHLCLRLAAPGYVSCY